MKTRKRVSAMPEAGLVVAIVDAQAAADAAGRIAADAAYWAFHGNAGADDAGEASRSAMRARHAAEKAERCTAEKEAWSYARLAWAAWTSAHEASDRVTAAIAEQLVVPTVEAKR